MNKKIRIQTSESGHAEVLYGDENISKFVRSVAWSVDSHHEEKCVIELIQVPTCVEADDVMFVLDQGPAISRGLAAKMGVWLDYMEKLVTGNCPIDRKAIRTMFEDEEFTLWLEQLAALGLIPGKNTAEKKGD